MSELIRVERETGLLTLRLDRQDKKNALTRAMYSRMAEALLEAQADTAVRVVLITGGDACFTSGNDILDFLEQPPSLRDSPVGRFMSALLEFPAGDRRGERTGGGYRHHPAAALRSGLRWSQRAIEDAVRQPRPDTGVRLEPDPAAHARSCQGCGIADAWPGLQRRAGGLGPGQCGAGGWRHGAGARPRCGPALPAPGALGGSGEQAPDESAVYRGASPGDRRGRRYLQYRLRSPEAIEALSAFMHRRQPDFSRFA